MKHRINIVGWTIVLTLPLILSCKVPDKNTVDNVRQLPVAVISPISVVEKGSLVNLNGSASYDPNGSPITYTWTMTAKPAASSAVLAVTASAATSFSADVSGDYGIQLVVSNGSENSHAASLTISSVDTTPTCTVDYISRVGTYGVLSVGPSEDIVPLCSGAVLVGDSAANRVRKISIVSGPTHTYQLSSSPGDLELDAQNGFLYAAHPAASYVTKIDIVNNIQSQLSVSTGAVHLAAGNNGEVFATIDSSTYWHPVALSSGASFSIISNATGNGYGELIVFDKTGNQLIAGITGLSPSSLTRSSYDPISHTLTESEYLWDTGGNGQDIAISPDDNHLAFVDGAGNGTPPYTIYDFSSQGFGTVYGAWNTGAYPTSADFDPSGKYLVATNRYSIQVFDVATHALLTQYSLDFTGCDYDLVKKVRFSRGGRIIYLFVNCGFTQDSGRLYWFVY